jgi:hypothetical protein
VCVVCMCLCVCLCVCVCVFVCVCVYVRVRFSSFSEASLHHLPPLPPVISTPLQMRRLEEERYKDVCADFNCTCQVQ